MATVLIIDNSNLAYRAFYGTYRGPGTPILSTDRGGQVIACISDTPTNKKALEEFGRRIDVLRGLITDSLRPEFIERTLSDLSQFKLLPEEISK